MQLLTLFLGVMGALLCALVLLRERGGLFLPRIPVLVFSLVIVWMFNLNWLGGVAIKEWGWISSFFLLSVAVWFLRRENPFSGIKEAIGKNVKKMFFVAGVSAGAILFAMLYFQWDLNVPRYSTPDSGVHFLYMHDTAQNGRMSLFGKDLIGAASGDNSILPRHNEAYMPGATAVFALLENFLKPRNVAKTLQVFNLACYALLAVYFVMLLGERELIKSRGLLMVFAVILLLGTFFNFVATSHSTQALGLLFLLGFVDFFEAYWQKKESWLPAALALGALVMTYFYWLPLALGFVGLRFFFSDFRKKIRQRFATTLLPLVGGFVFCVGYVVVLFELNMFQYASADGGVAFQEYLLKDALLIAPIAFFQLLFLIRLAKKDVENRKFAAAFFGATAFFVFVLALCYKNAFLISHYSAMKVLYLVVPSAWALFFIFIEDHRVGMIRLTKNFFGSPRSILESGKWKAVVFLLFLFSFTAISARAFEVDYACLPLMKKNLELILKEKTDPSISAEQMEILDLLKANHKDLLSDGQILIVAPTRSALWAFAYSGIWPRTKSLVPPEGSRAGIFSQLSFYSDGIADYGLWLKQDKKHALVYFDTEDGENWIDRSMFDFNDYQLIESEGGNRILKLKQGETVDYAWAWKKNEEKSVREILPLEIDFVSEGDFLGGFFVRFQVEPKKNVLNDVVGQIFEGSCSGKKAVDKKADFVIVKNDLVKKGEKRTSRVLFEEFLPDAKNKKWCIRLEAPDEKTAKAVGVGRFEDGGYEINPIYSFLQKQPSE